MVRPRPRFGLKFLMSAVAVVALLIFGNQTYQRWRQARNWMVYHDIQARPFESNIEAMKPGLVSFERLAVAVPEQAGNYRKGAQTLRDAIALSGRWAAYHRALERKYRRAASRPWIPIPADPPPPG